MQGAAACVNDMGYYGVLPCHKDQKGPERGPALREQGAASSGAGAARVAAEHGSNGGPPTRRRWRLPRPGTTAPSPGSRVAGRRPDGGQGGGDAEGYRGRAAARSRRGRSQPSGPGPVPGARRQQDSPMFRGRT